MDVHLAAVVATFPLLSRDGFAAAALPHLGEISPLLAMDVIESAFPLFLARCVTVTASMLGDSRLLPVLDEPETCARLNREFATLASITLGNELARARLVRRGAGPQERAECDCPTPLRCAGLGCQAKPENRQ